MNNDELKQIELKFNTININSDEEYARAGDYLKEVKCFIKAIEQKKKELVKPFKDSIKNLEAEFKLPLSKAETIKAEIESIISAYVIKKEEEEKQKALAKKALELQMLEFNKSIQEMDNNNDFEINAINNRINKLENTDVDVNVGIKGNFSSTLIRKKINYEVVDISLVDRKYLMVDDKVIKQALSNGVNSIPGIRIFEENIIVSR